MSLRKPDGNTDDIAADTDSDPYGSKNNTAGLPNTPARQKVYS